MKNFIKICVLALMVASCGDFEPVVDDGSQTLAFFSNSTSNLEVLVDAAGSVDIEIGMSTLSTSDRTVTVSVDEETTTADASNYNVPTSVVIPANEYFGILTVTGVDNTVETSSETIALLLGFADGAVSPNPHSVSIFQVCPIPSDFLLGDYELIDVLATVGPGNGTENLGGQVVTIAENTATSRIFQTSVLPAFTGGTQVDIFLDLVCNTITMRDVGSGLGCGGGGGAEYIFIQQASGLNASYDIADDTSFIITYIEDPDGSCGGPFDASFMLTKL